MANRFEQVDESSDDAITLSLYKKEGKTYGNIVTPPRVEGGSIVADVMMGEQEALNALGAAVNLANKRGTKIVVCDPDNLWQSEWGELYRA